MTGDAKQRGLAHFTPTSGWTITYHSTSDQWFIQCQGQSLPLLITHPFIQSFKPNSRAPTGVSGMSKGHEASSIVTHDETNCARAASFHLHSRHERHLLGRALTTSLREDLIIRVPFSVSYTAHNSPLS